MSIYLCSLGTNTPHPDDVSKIEAASPKKAAEIYSEKVERPSLNGDTYPVSVREETKPQICKVFAVTLKTVQVREAKEWT